MMKSIRTKWHNKSLRTKWFYSIAMTIVGVYTVVCVIIYIALYAWLSESEKNNATRTVDDLQGFFTSQLSSISIRELQQQKGLMQAILTQDQTVRLYTIDGVELLQINDTIGNAPILHQSDRIVVENTIDETDVFVVQDILLVEGSPMIVQLIHPLTSFQSMMRYVFVTMLIMGIGALVLSGLISSILAGRFMRPLQELRNSMLQVKEQGVSANAIEVESSNDELGDVLHIYNEMLQQLDESFQRQQQFVFDASHELRTPIQAIEGNLKLIQRWGKNDAEVLEESLQISLDEINRMKKLMEELLELARHQKVEEPPPLELQPVLKRVTAEYDVPIQMSIMEENAAISISEQALMQIMRNLIENSIKYSTATPMIKIVAKREHNTVTLIVKDNGVGISKKHLPYVFDRFFRADDARLHVEGSTGLGLSIVKMLVEKYRGSIEVDSELEIGTVFTLRFPLKKV